jgi:hypothetical protein
MTATDNDDKYTVLVQQRKLSSMTSTIHFIFTRAKGDHDESSTRSVCIVHVLLGAAILVNEGLLVEQTHIAAALVIDVGCT